MPTIKVTKGIPSAKLTRAEVRAIETTRSVCQCLVKYYPPVMTPADAADEELEKLLVHFGEIQPETPMDVTEDQERKAG